MNKGVKQEADGSWGVTVWFGPPWRDTSGNWTAQTVRRYYYRTRAQARLADISDNIGTCGRKMENKQQQEVVK